MPELEQKRVSRRQLLTAAGAGTIAALSVNPNVVIKGFIDAVANYYSDNQAEKSLLHFGSKAPTLSATERHLTSEWLMDLVTPGKAEAAMETAQVDNGMIIGREGVWPAKDWWPIFASKALQLDLPRIHDTWWPAHALDILGILPCRIQKQAADKANTIIKEWPDSAGFAGYCPWLAAAQLLEAQPQAIEGEDFAGAEDPEKISRLKQGGLVIAHSGDFFVPMPVTAEALTALVLNKLPVAVNLPASLGAGDWFRPLLGISSDGSLVRVTDFRNPTEFDDGLTDLSRLSITAAYLVFGSDDVSADISQQIKDSTAFWRYDLDRQAVRRLVFS